MNVQTPAFDYQKAKYEFINCNLCGQNNFAVLAERDRYHLKVRTCFCKNCGLIYLNPRLTAEWYQLFYQNEYRQQNARFRGVPNKKRDLKISFLKATDHGRSLYQLVENYLQPGLTVDVGSGTGGVLNGFRQSSGNEVLGIEPSLNDAHFAETKGIKTLNFLLEDLNVSLPKIANLLCLQTFNHLLNPKFFLDWSYQNLTDSGILVLEVLNFRQLFKNLGWLPRATQIDHPFMFLPEILKQMAVLAGFEIIFEDINETRSFEDNKKYKNLSLPKYHIRIVAKKTGQRPLAKEQMQKIDPRRTAELFTELMNLKNSKFYYHWRKSLNNLRRQIFKYF